MLLGSKSGRRRRIRQYCTPHGGCYKSNGMEVFAHKTYSNVILLPHVMRNTPNPYLINYAYFVVFFLQPAHFISKRECLGMLYVIQ